MAVLITEVEPSAAVIAKINQKHGLTIWDVEHALEHKISAAWNEDEERGRRLLVVGMTYTGLVIRVILYPVDEAVGTFRLGTAFP